MICRFDVLISSPTVGCFDRGASVHPIGPGGLPRTRGLGAAVQDLSTSDAGGERCGKIKHVFFVF